MGNAKAPVLPGDAYAIDSKTDDGLPLSGSVVALGATIAFTSDEWWVASRPASQGAAGSASCVNNAVSPAGYNTSYKNGVCAVQVKAAF